MCNVTILGNNVNNELLLLINMYIIHAMTAPLVTCTIKIAECYACSPSTYLSLFILLYIIHRMNDNL